MYSHAHVLTKELTEATFADGAAVVMDTAKYVLKLVKFFLSSHTYTRRILVV